jgi:hypothetical protein
MEIGRDLGGGGDGGMVRQSELARAQPSGHQPSFEPHSDASKTAALISEASQGGRING